ncbi:MAG: HAD-IIB family hydrolase [Ruminococcaceae bacterium]|nr:HAD-IIB family hydrolase [Oscillospiraceae bacterium]
MGKFDGVLLATDWDGTFYHDNRLFDENLKALKYFTENGGKFTICSGRYHEFLRTFAKRVYVNTYVSCYNGAHIINLDDNDILYEGFCDDKLFDILDRLFSSDAKYKTITFCTKEYPEPLEYNTADYETAKQALRGKYIYKVLLRAENAADAANGLRIVKQMELGDYIGVRSWEFSMEFLKRENAKGAAVRRIAKKLSSKLVVAVGDYENDIDLILAADIGYAVGNAVDTLKAVADRITVNVTESAIAQIIYDLDRELQ